MIADILAQVSLLALPANAQQGKAELKAHVNIPCPAGGEKGVEA